MTIYIASLVVEFTNNSICAMGTNEHERKSYEQI